MKRLGILLIVSMGLVLIARWEPFTRLNAADISAQTAEVVKQATTYQPKAPKAGAPAEDKAAIAAFKPADLPLPTAESLAKNRKDYEPFGWRKGLKDDYYQARDLVAKKPSDPAANYQLAMACGYTGKLEEAWGQLVKVGDLDPNFKLTGTQQFEKQVKADPDNWKVRFGLAFGYFVLERKQAAIKQFEAILDMYPDHIWAMNYLAYVWADLGQPERAIALWQLSNKLDPKVPATHFVLGQAYLRTNRYWKATEEIAVAFKLRAQGYW